MGLNSVNAEAGKREIVVFDTSPKETEISREVD